MPQRNPNDPYPFDCGGAGQPACPPQPTATIADPSQRQYTHEDMLKHGHEQYQKGRKDALEASAPEVDPA